MNPIENVLLDFYTCVHIPVQFIDQKFTSIFNIDIHKSINEFISSTSLYLDLKKGINTVTTLTYFDNIHFIVVPLLNYHQLPGYFIAGPFHSANVNSNYEFVYKPFDCLSYLGKLFESIMKQHLFSEPKFNTYVREGIHYIHKNYDKNITLTKVCKDLNVNKSYFCCIFKNETGMTFSNFLNRMRIEKSKQYLIQNNESILSIALSVGFNNHNYYTMMFKKLTGISPIEFRQQNKKEFTLKTKAAI